MSGHSHIRAQPHRDLRVGLGGLGTIGGAVASRLDQGVPGLKLGAVAARDENKASGRIRGFVSPVPVVSLGALAENADVVLECASMSAFAEIAEPAIRAGRVFMPVISGGLLVHPEFIEWAKETGARIIVPSGGLVGLDGLRAAAECEIRSATLEHFPIILVHILS